ncbi:BTAD domain-containing putative transcriptional regulator, partial [Lentzea sp. NPDC006480]|uniref:AfsR/SARP family transcriptional regulator n=1 Tax=Lentzea sp. NPDC006480 TaxID=3157176 RepID=UPI0033B6B27F
MVEIDLLGEVSARVGGHHVELGPARQRCVLAALAVDVNKTVSITQLTERVWGDEPPAQARSTLHSYLSRLRQAGIELATRPTGYALVAEESSVDLMRFRKLRKENKLGDAIALWRGEPLTGIAGEWAQLTRDRLNEERDAAELDLIDARLQLGRGPELLASIAAHATDKPLDERVAAQHMRALAQAGRIPEALDQFHALRTRL